MESVQHWDQIYTEHFVTCHLCVLLIAYTLDLS
jgi:hypothetical protein